MVSAAVENTCFMNVWLILEGTSSNRHSIRHKAQTSRCDAICLTDLVPASMKDSKMRSASLSVGQLLVLFSFLLLNNITSLNTNQGSSELPQEL